MFARSLLSILTPLLVAGCATAATPEPPHTPPAASENAPPQPRPPVEGSVASRDGVSIHYTDQGSGRTTVVFVHCWSCNARYWDAAVAHLSPRYRTITLDLAGHGASGRNRTEWTVEAFGRDVDAVLEKLDLRGVVLVGHSMGGPVIVEAARLAPGRVAALVPVDTLLKVSTPPDPSHADKLGADLRADFQGLTRKLVKQLFPAGASGAVFDRVTRDMSGADPAVAIPAITASWRYDAGPVLAALKLPVRSINADQSPTDIEGNRKVAPGFDAIIVHGVGHWLMLEAPDQFDAALDRTLAALSL